MAKRIDKRLNDLEKETGGERPFMALWQDLEDETLFHTTSRFRHDEENDKVYTQDQVSELAETHMIFQIVYDKNWGGQDERL